MTRSPCIVYGVNRVGGRAPFEDLLMTSLIVLKVFNFRTQGKACLFSQGHFVREIYILQLGQKPKKISQEQTKFVLWTSNLALDKMKGSFIKKTKQIVGQDLLY